MKHDIERRGEILADILRGETKSKADYAFEHKVAEITINRDLQWFRQNGIPVYSKNGKVIIEGKFAKSNLNRILSEYLSVKLNASFYLDNIEAVSYSHSKVYFQNLVLVTKAVKEKREIKIHYKRITDGIEVVYNVKPVKLLLSGFNWIMQAIKEGESLVKIFYVTRIRNIELLDKNFELESPKQQSKEQEKIKIKFSKSVRAQLTDKIWFPEFELTEDEEGNVILETEQEINNALAGWCVSWWDKIEILEPDYLKEHISNMIAAFNSKNR